MVQCQACVKQQSMSAAACVPCAQVCAPYAALQGYKFRVKLTPGTQRKGRAGRQVGPTPCPLRMRATCACMLACACMHACMPCSVCFLTSCSWH
jgi:hypothetical protein